MKSTKLASLILYLSVSFVYGQQNKSAGNVCVSTTKKSASDFSVLKPFTEMGDLWGYKNSKTGKVVIEPAYYEAAPFSFGLALVSNEKSKKGFINSKGEVIVLLIYDGAFSYTEGLAAVNTGRGFDENNSFINGNWGFIDVDGKEIIPFTYTDVKPFSEGLAAVEINNAWGFINKSGKLVIFEQYNQTYSFSEGLALVNNFDKWGYIDKLGETIIPFIYNFGQSFKNGKAEVDIKGKKVYINKKGELIKK